MNLIICGGRDFQDHEVFYRAVTSWVARYGRPSLILSGGATGADAMAKAWAEWEGIPFKEYRADWGRYGRAAGPKRNEEMARAAGGCLALPGGRGTADMVRQARALGLVVMEW